jgi:hypothetical protein
MFVDITDNNRKIRFVLVLDIKDELAVEENNMIKLFNIKMGEFAGRIAVVK